MSRLLPLIGWILVTAMFAFVTATIGWWAVPIVAAALGSFATRRRAAWGIALAGAVAWGALLAWSAMHAPVMRLASELSGIMQLPVPAILLVTLAFPALLAWSAARVANGLTRRAS